MYYTVKGGGVVIFQYNHDNVKNFGSSLIMNFKQGRDKTVVKYTICIAYTINKMATHLLVIGHMHSKYFRNPAIVSIGAVWWRSALVGSER